MFSNSAGGAFWRLVIAGLDPAIKRRRSVFGFFRIHHRVEPGGDKGDEDLSGSKPYCTASRTFMNRIVRWAVAAVSLA